jgi:hypothetical protein
MRTLTKLTLLLLPLLTATVVKAQEFGGNPPSINWKQVNTPAARVIFPVGMDSAGIRVSDIINQMNDRISNGYVGLAPFRSEYYLTPDQNSFELGSLRWTDQLAVHEFRHVQQYNNFNVGGSKLLRILFGDGGQAIGNSLAIPNWFFEGDAVYNETYVTKQGRGRLPYFYNGYRALWAAGKDYSWMKLRNGSYQDYVPDWYPMGYMMVSYGREKYGDDFWKKVTHDAASFDGLFFPMQHAIKQYTTKDFKTYRTDALGYYKQEFGLTVPTIPTIKKNQHFIADQEYPAYVDDNTIIYTKTTYDHPSAFVMRTGDKERVIASRTFSLDSYFDYHDGKIIYASYQPDLRWNYRDYSEITMVDVQSGAETRITKGTKYFSPSLSEDGKKIVAVQVTPDGKNELHLLDISGKVLTVVPNKEHLFYTYPKFYGDKIIAAVRKPDGEMSIASIDVNNGNTEYLLAFSIKPIAFPSIHKDLVYFSATVEKNDGLFALSLTNKKLYRLQNDSTKTAIGNYQPTVWGNKIAWVSFTAFGYKLHHADRNKLPMEEVTGNAIPGNLPDFDIAALGKGDAADLLASVTNAQPPVTKYHKGFHLINFHTLEPTISDPNYTLTLEGDNVLNTLQTNLLFNYNRNEGYDEFGFGTVYGALFPYLSAGVDYIINREVNSNLGPQYYNQLQYHGGFELPFNFTTGHNSTGLAVGSDVVYSRNYFSPPFDKPQFEKELLYLNNYISFSNRSRMAKKNIYPSLGQSIYIDYKGAINGVNANQFLATGDFYFPGLFANHSLVISAAYQQHDKDNNGNFSNDFPFVRGYTAENLYQLSKVSVNYHFPLFYPDAGLLNAAYLTRVRGNVFYDYGHGNDFYTNGSTFKADFKATGVQLFLDGQLWNQLPYTIGIRYSHLLDKDIFGGTGSNRIEVVLPVSFY